MISSTWTAHTQKSVPQTVREHSDFHTRVTIYKNYIIGILRGYTIRSGRCPEGSQRPQGGQQVPPSHWLPEGCIIQYKHIVSTTIVKLWNYKSNDLPKNGLSMRPWHCQPSHQLDKVSEGQRATHLLNNTRTVLRLQLRPSIYMGLFHKNVLQIALNPTRNL